VASIRVTRTGETDDGFTFDVEVTDSESSTKHVVTLSRADFAEQTGRFPYPEEFVRRCFQFLLEREPKESILGRFDVRDIGRYFPEFEHNVLHPEG
jgi:hypothetical protein